MNHYYWSMSRTISNLIGHLESRHIWKKYNSVQPSSVNQTEFVENTISDQYLKQQIGTYYLLFTCWQLNAKTLFEFFWM